jgi:hypothetical protein
MLPEPATRPLLVRSGAVALAAMATLALVACGSKGGGEEDTRSVEDQIGLEGDAILARQAKAENLIRDCMKAQGFDYIPVDPVAQRAQLVGQPGMTEEEFNKQFGYGITTLYEQKETEDATGPNKEIRDALGPADQAAYDRALYGDDPSATFAVALDTGDFSRLGGCVKQAAEKVFGGVDVIESLQSKLDELDDRILADPRMVKAVAAWSACMGKGGFQLQDPDQVDTTLQTKLDTIVGPPDNPNPDFDHAALAALQQEEVSMVASDISCEEQNITPVEDQVRPEYEAAFREENAALLNKVPPP